MILHSSQGSLRLTPLFDNLEELRLAFWYFLQAMINYVH